MHEGNTRLNQLVVCQFVTSSQVDTLEAFAVEASIRDSGVEHEPEAVTLEYGRALGKVAAPSWLNHAILWPGSFI